MEPVPVLPNQMSREWAFGSLGGAGVRVAVVDSGIERGHPVVGEVQQAVAVADDGERVIDDEEGDLCGHGFGLDVALQHGWEQLVAGVNPSEQSRQSLRLAFTIDDEADPHSASTASTASGAGGTASGTMPVRRYCDR